MTMGKHNMSTVHSITSRIRSNFSRSLAGGPHHARVPRLISRPVRRNGRSDGQMYGSPTPSPVGQRRSSSSSSWSDGVAVQAIIGSLSGVLILGFGGYLYHTWYKYSVIKKMAVAFKPGYDPVLILDKASRQIPNNKPVEATDDEEIVEEIGWIPRREQELIDQIVHGELAGQYWLITGPKGTGKFALIADAMTRNQADGIAVCECSDDLEIFRLRLGKCLNFQFAEDYIGGYLLTLALNQRALGKLQKVAVDYHSKHSRPLVLVFNNIHHLRQEEGSYSLLLQLQQRAESWAQAGIVTLIFCSDDHWPYALLKKNASRMSVLTVKDLTKQEAMRAMRTERKKLWGESRVMNDPEIESIWRLVGGRISHLRECMKHKDMIRAAELIIEREKQWLLSQIGLIVDCDDDVMDEQKWASASFLLMQALVKNADEPAASRPNSHHSHRPKGIPYAVARQIMTRTDFISKLDHENMIAIDINYRIKPNSTVILNVIRELCNEPDFQERLDSVLERISDIESLGRTRELLWKSGKDGHGVMNIKIEDRQQV
ncbi:hypothetical protein PSTT_16092 [Puccinia striiformis]|uniref:AAA protein C-terminal winged helix domain-containing protein n=1 Tax=Puccinia striiformis TaxID=27350 RepID=A0A2S4UEG8_9BASI|nr:hypothetical protein PSTT_16092 [Puccinia striiformis]